MLATAKLLIVESRLLKRAAEEIKSQEKVDMVKIARKERIACSKKLKIAKEALVREKEEKQNLMETKRLMEEKNNALTDELLTLKKTLSSEIENRKGLQKQTESERDKVLNERGKRYEVARNAQNILKAKQDEIKELTKTLFEMSEEFSGIKKEKTRALKSKHKIEVLLQKKNVELNKLLKKNEELRESMEEDKKHMNAKEVKNSR